MMTEEQLCNRLGDLVKDRVTAKSMLANAENCRDKRKWQAALDHLQEEIDKTYAELKGEAA